MHQIQDYEISVEDNSLQVEAAKDWIKKRFISELEFDRLPFPWATVWATAVTELGYELTESLLERMTKGEEV